MKVLNKSIIALVAVTGFTFASTASADSIHDALEQNSLINQVIESGPASSNSVTAPVTIQDYVDDQRVA